MNKDQAALTVKIVQAERGPMIELEFAETIGTIGGVYMTVDQVRILMEDLTQALGFIQAWDTSDQPRAN